MGARPIDERRRGGKREAGEMPAIPVMGGATQPFSRKLPPRWKAPELSRGDQALLSWCDRLAPAYRACGVDYDAFRILLETRLRVRRRSGDRDSDVAGSRLPAGFYALFIMGALHAGAALGGLAFLLDEQPFLWMGLAQATLLVFAAAMLGLDIVPRLLDTSDLSVLGSVPIQERAFLAVRATETLWSAFGIGVAFVLPAISIASFVYPPQILVPIFPLISCATTVIAIASLLFVILLILKTLDVARFKDALAYLQVGCVLALQVIPRVIDLKPIVELFVEHPRLWALLPPACFGGLFRWVLGRGQDIDLTLATGALLWPTVSLLAVVLLARRGVIGRLIALAEEFVARERSHARTYGISGLAGRRLASCGARGAGYHLAIAVFAKDAQVHTRVWPGVLIPFFIVFALLRGEGVAGFWGALPFAIYGLGMLWLAAMNHAQQALGGKSEELFLDLSREERQEFARGVVAALMVRYVGVPWLLIALVGGMFGGLAHHVDLLFATLVTFSILLTFAPHLVLREPLAPPPGADSTSAFEDDGCLPLLGFMLSLLLALSLHFGARLLPGVLPIASLALVPVASWSWRYHRRTPLAFARKKPRGTRLPEDPPRSRWQQGGR